MNEHSKRASLDRASEDWMRDIEVRQRGQACMANTRACWPAVRHSLPLDALRRLRWQPLCFTRLPVALLRELRAQMQMTSLLLLLAQQRNRQKLCQRQQV